MNNNQQIIHYIKVREAWKDFIQIKSRSLSVIWNGLFRFGSFLAYWGIEKIFLREQIELMYLTNPNYRYIFYLSLAFGLWGLFDAFLGMISYFQANEQEKQLKKRVGILEKDL